MLTIFNKDDSPLSRKFTKLFFGILKITKEGREMS